MPELDAKVEGFLTALSSAAPGSPEFSAQAEHVRTMGDADIRKAAETSNRMLEQPVRALKEGGLAQGSAVGKTLIELRRTIEDLDPSQAGIREVEVARVVDRHDGPAGARHVLEPPQPDPEALGREE